MTWRGYIIITLRNTMVKSKTGEPFVYYRGVHREGGKRGQAQYVGAGRIGEIWPDPDPGINRRKAWYCGIEDYERFHSPVPAKIDNVNLEIIPTNLWRDGVRSLDPNVYNRIINLASGSQQKAVSSATAIPLSAVNSLIIPPGAVGPRKDQRPSAAYRKSKRAKEVGDWAEQVVVRFVQERIRGCKNCIHRAAANETPGWDIDYLDSKGELQCVEVKGTVGAGFAGIEMTANEIQAARTHGENYWLYLVAGCLTDTPRIPLIQNPGAKLSAGEWSAAPTLFAVRFDAT